MLRILGFVMLLLSILFTAAPSCEKNEKDLSAANAKDLKNGSCGSDDDCTVEKADCCGCRQNGAQISILKTQVVEYRREKALECADTFCAQVISKDQSCSLKPKCIDGKCELK